MKHNHAIARARGQHRRLSRLPTWPAQPIAAHGPRPRYRLARHRGLAAIVREHVKLRCINSHMGTGGLNPRGLRAQLPHAFPRADSTRAVKSSNQRTKSLIEFKIASNLWNSTL